MSAAGDICCRIFIFSLFFFLGCSASGKIVKLLPRFIVHFFFVVVGGLFVEKLNNFGASAVCGNFSHIFHGRTVCLFSIFVFFCFTVAVIVLSPR